MTAEELESRPRDASGSGCRSHHRLARAFLCGVQSVRCPGRYPAPGEAREHQLGLAELHAHRDCDERLLMFAGPLEPRTATRILTDRD